MGCRHWPDQFDPLNLFCLRCMDFEIPAVKELLRYRFDEGPGPTEQIWRMINFQTQLVVPPVRVGTGRKHATVGQQESDRVIHSRGLCSSGRNPGVFSGVIYLGL